MTGSQIRIPVSMGSAESYQAGSERTVKYDESVATIVNDGSALKPSASLGARHTVDEPSNPLFNPAVMADSSRQATDFIVAPATAAVCPGIVTRQSQSLFKDGTDQNAVPVRIEKAGLHYRVINNSTRNFALFFLLIC